MGMFATMTLIASMLAAPVQISFSPPMVRVGETVPVQVQWAGEAPADAQFQWSASAGEVRENGPGAYVYVPADTPGRAFVHLAVTTPAGPWAESAAPVLVYRQFVILKADDLVRVPDEGWNNWVRYMDEVVTARGIKVAVGAIGQRMSLPSEEVRARVKAWNATGVVEFFNHGYDHASYAPPPSKAALPPGTTYEFQGRPYEEQYAHLERTQEIIRGNYGVQMRSFGAPFNKWDENTVLALRNLGQIDVWMMGSAKSECFNLPRGGGEIEGPSGVPSLDEYLATHDPARPVVLLQHHPYLAPFWDGWDGFKAILDQIEADGGTFILPGEYADLVNKGTLPLEPGRLFPDAALECAVRMAQGSWQDNPAKTGETAITWLEWAGRMPHIRSLAGLERCTALRMLDLRDNNLPDIGPVLALWQAVGANMTVRWEGNPVSDYFACDMVPRYEAQGLQLSVTGPCDNVLVTLRVEGQGTLDPSAGDHAVSRSTALTVHAVPAPGWEFVSWEGAPEAVPGSPDLTIIPAAPRSITARFEKRPSFPVTVDAAVNGTVALAPAQLEGGYVTGTKVTVTATPNAGFVFDHWTGDLAGTTANPASLTVDSNKTVGAVFSKAPYVYVWKAARQLLDGFAAADTDHGGGLSMAEATATIPGLTEDQFNLLDADGDGQLTQSELNQLLNPIGCNCGKANFTMNGLKDRLADFFLSGLAVLALVAFSARKPIA